MTVNLKTLLMCCLLGVAAVAGVASAHPAGSPDNATADDRHGPPENLPGPVPDFVGDILNLIDQKLSGVISGQELGDALSGLLGGGEGAAKANG